jgi:hypothetical protein
MDTVMRFFAPSDGYYPMRLVMDQGAGGGNVEFWMPNSATVSIDAVNSDLIPAYRYPDLNPPVITCPQNQAVECGVPLNFVVIAIDPEDGPIVPVCVPPVGSKFPTGETTVTCTAVDGFGNQAQCSFVVTATDTVPPVVTCPANITVDACGNPNGKVVEFTATALDQCAGALPVTCVPASGSTFPVGDTTVICTATDQTQLVGECTFNVIVNAGDTTPPVVTCPQDVVFECSPNGNNVNYPPATAVDNCDGVIQTVECLPPSGSVFLLGDTTVTCTASDAAQNVGRCTFVVRVVDTTPPVIMDCVDKVVCSEVPVAVQFDTIAIDSCGSASITCNPSSGSTFQCGETTVNCTATDEHNNSATCSFKVTVKCDKPTLHYTRDGMTLTLTWTKSNCYTLFTRANDLGIAAGTWAAYTGTITDDGTTCTAIIQVPAQGNLFFLLK